MCSIIESPIGFWRIDADGDYITGVNRIEKQDIINCSLSQSKVLEQCGQELLEYFEGSRKEFTVKFQMKGTDFQKKIWQALLAIPYGHTASYKDIAIAVDKPKAARAVGGANHNNPISIIVPCHRVIGANGSLTGYGGGLDCKEWLLNHEKKGNIRN